MKLPVQILTVISCFLFLNIPLTTWGQFDPISNPWGGACKPSFINDFCAISGDIEWTEIAGATEYRINIEYGTQAASFTQTENKLYISNLESHILLPIGEDFDPNNPYTITITPLFLLPGICNSSADNPPSLIGVYEGCPSFKARKKGDPKDCCGFAALDDDGEFSVNSSGNGNKTNFSSIKTSFSLAPNPFQDQLQITATLPQTQQTSIQIYNANGQLVRQVTNNESLSKGTHILSIETSELGTGIYYCVFKAGKESITQKVIKY